MTRERRFKAGDQAEFSGIRFRVVQGVKHRHDLRLDWLTEDGWVPVALDALFYMVDMIAENEDVLYPYPARGGEEVIAYCRLARQKGWQAARYKLHLARGDKQERLDNGEAEAS